MEMGESDREHIRVHVWRLGDNAHFIEGIAADSISDEHTMYMYTCMRTHLTQSWCVPSLS